MSDEFLSSARAEIEAHGYQVVLVPSADPEQPAFAFTIGLQASFDHPELVCIGLDEAEPDGTMHDLLDAAAEAVRDGGTFTDGDRNSELILDYPLTFRTVAAPAVEQFLPVLPAYYGADTVRCLQIVWPDRRGRFPWEENCEAEVRAGQPLLCD